MTPDGRYLIVSGRRWRSTDPAIPDSLRQELVNELMAARRLVRSDPNAARPRVQDAKVAAELSRDGIITVRQRGLDVDVATAVGPIRIARGPGW